MGDKFGKSAGNAVWLSPKRTSPFTFYQFWMRLPDADCERMLKLFTFDTIGSISDLMRQHEQKPDLRLPQKRLAEQVCFRDCQIIELIVFGVGDIVGTWRGRIRKSNFSN